MVDFDAVLAALAIETTATVCSTDRDFRRFAGLSLIDSTDLPQ
jgi:predicted nucleic acid-binding protein